jgi:hypothetical protein
VSRPSLEGWIRLVRDRFPDSELRDINVVGGLDQARAEYDPDERFDRA